MKLSIRDQLQLALNDAVGVGTGEVVRARLVLTDHGEVEGRLVWKRYKPVFANSPYVGHSFFQLPDGTWSIFSGHYDLDKEQSLAYMSHAHV